MQASGERRLESSFSGSFAAERKMSRYCLLSYLPAIERQREPERAAFADGAVHRDRPAHLVNDGFRDEQAQAHSPEAAGADRGLALVEAAEDAGLLVLRDADAPIPNGHLGIFAVPLHPDLNLAAIGRVLDGVADEVAQHLV